MAKKKKNSKTITHVAILLDKSGSMGRTRAQAIQGYNEQIQQIKENAKDQDIRCYLLTFNGDVWEHAWGVPADQLTEATEADYVPNGGTAMRDAIGYTIQKLIDTTDPNESDNVAYLLYVISDGETLNDKNFSVPQLRELVGGVQATGKWTISYMLGCNESYLHEVARQTGVSLSNMARFSNANARDTVKGFEAATVRSTGYFKARGQGITASCTYMNDQAGQIANFVGPIDDAANSPATILPTNNGMPYANLQNAHPGVNASASLSPNIGRTMGYTMPESVTIDDDNNVEIKTTEPLKTKTVDELRKQRTYALNATRSTGKGLFGNSASVKWG